MVPERVWEIHIGNDVWRKDDAGRDNLCEAFLMQIAKIGEEQSKS